MDYQNSTNTISDRVLQKDSSKELKNKSNGKNQTPLVTLSFTITYYLLIFSSCISFVACLLVKIPDVRIILIIETMITFIASFMYSLFSQRLQRGEPNVLVGIDKLRYMGWSFSTPLMLIALCLILSHNSKIAIQPLTMVAIVVLDLMMLLFGYLGDAQKISRWTAFFLGYVPFFAMFYIIYVKFIKPVYNQMNYFFFIYYLLFWCAYGIIYVFDEDTKIVLTNILDCISKACIGLGLSTFYLSKMIW